jgi:hypothetical protein
LVCFDELGHLRSMVRARCASLDLHEDEADSLLDAGLGASANAIETRLRIVDEILMLAVAVFGATRGGEWLRHHGDIFAGRTPLDMAMGNLCGARRVRDHLRILHDALVD